MGTVYQAEPDDGCGPVALKVLLPGLSENLEYLKRFRREIRACSRLTSQRVVHILGWGEDEGTFYYAMELLEGGRDLARVLRDEGKLEPDLVLRIGVQLCEALAELHETGVVHRDIKPGNLMLMPDGNVKLMDFGLAKLLDRTSLTATGEALGSPRYMSPEVLRGRPVDFRSDVYQVGTVLYELVTGEPAFDGESFEQLLHVILETTALDAGTLRPELSPDFCAVIRTCLRKNPPDRYRTADELRANLEAVQDGRAPLPPVGGRVSGKVHLSKASTAVSSEAEEDVSDLASRATRAVKQAQRSWPLVLFLCVAFALVAVLATRQPPPAMDPQPHVRYGFDAVEVSWKTAVPVNTSVRVKKGDESPVKRYTNAVEQACFSHSIVLRGLEPKERYRVLLGGARKPFRRVVDIELKEASPPSRVRVVREQTRVAVDAAYSVPVLSRLRARVRGENFESPHAKVHSQEIRCFLDDVPAHADIQSLDLVLQDLFGDERPFALGTYRGAASTLLLAYDGERTSWSRALANFEPSALCFFTDDRVSVARKLELYRALVTMGATSLAYRGFVDWSDGTNVKAVVSSKPFDLTGPLLPMSLYAQAPGGAEVGRGAVFVARLDTHEGDGNCRLLLERGELLKGGVLRITFNDGFSLVDSRAGGPVVSCVEFPISVLRTGINTVRVLLESETAGATTLSRIELQFIPCS